MFAIMAPHRTEQSVRTFTLDQLRNEHSHVSAALKKDGGCIVVDKNGRRIFSLWNPQGPLDND